MGSKEKVKEKPKGPEAEFQAVLQDAAKLYKESKGQSINEYMSPRMNSIEDLKMQLNVNNERFSSFRSKRAALFGVLSTMLKPVEIVGEVVTGAAGEVFPATQSIFGAVMFLINAANNVSSTYDSILDLFNQLKDFTPRLEVYLKHKMSPGLREKVVNIFASLFEVLVLARKEIRGGRVKAYFRNLFNSNSHVQEALERLKQQTQGEVRQVAADTYDGVSTIGKRADKIEKKTDKIDTKTDRVEDLVTQVSQNVQELRAETRERTTIAHQDRLREVLGPSPFPDDYYQSFEKFRVKDTGKWLLDDSSMQTWIQGDTQFLWMSGGPGTGKSYLATRLITWGTDNLPYLGYFYFRSNNPETRSVLQALRDVAYQLSESDGFYGKQILQTVRSADDIKTIASAYRKLFVEPFKEDSRERRLHVFLDGIDEAETGEIEEFLAQLEPAEAESRSKGRSTVQFALIGRSYMSEIITSHLDPPNSAHSLTIVQVTPDRNADDVKKYIMEGVANSRILSRSSADFKNQVVDMMEKRVDGLFILAKFMLADMNRKRRPTSILESLDSFPPQINGMLQQTLANLSSTIGEEEAADLNEMLRWTTCAEQALTLEQLEAILILRFDDPPFRFEDTLRGQYACFFELEREDGLTTDDLTKDHERLQREQRRGSTPTDRVRRSSSVGKRSPKRNISPGEINPATRRRTSPVTLDTDVRRHFSPTRSPTGSHTFRRSGDGFDSDSELEYRSKKSSTTVSFFHISIREFFRDDDASNAASTGNGPKIGFNNVEAKTHVLKTCLRIFDDKGWFVNKRLGKKKYAIRQYAAWYWQEHLKALSPKEVDEDDKRIIGQQLYRMLTDEEVILDWSILYEKNDEGLEVMMDSNMKAIRTWMEDPDVLASLEPAAKKWAEKASSTSIGMVEKIGRFYAKAWLDEKHNCYVPTKFCFKIVQSIAFMDEGHKWSDSQCHWSDISVSERIQKATKWAGFKKTAHWYRRVGSTFLTAGMHSEALDHYNEALKLDKNSVETLGRKAYCLSVDQRHGEALELTLACEKEEEKLIASGKLSDAEMTASKWRLYRDHFLIAQCFYRLADVDNSVEYFQKAITSVDSANLEYSERFEPVIALLEVLAAENRYGEMMKLIQGQSLQAAGPRREQSRLIDLLLAQYNQSLVLDWVPKAACKTGEAEFLIDRLQLSIECALEKRDALKELYLRLALGTTLIFSRNIEEAIEVFEQISLVEYRPRGNVPTRQAHAISFQKLASLYKYEVLRAGITNVGADRWIQRLETVQRKQGSHQNLEMPASMLGSDINAASVYLSLFYRLRNRKEESEALSSALIVESCEILEDEELRNDEFALENLLKLFVAADDETNARALAVSMRSLNPEASFSSSLSDSPIQQRGHVEPKLPDIQSSNRSCAQCLEIIAAPVEFFMCKYCLDSYCRRCVEKVIKPSKDKVVEGIVCRADHEWFKVDPLAKNLHTGEVLVDGKVVAFGNWKDGIRNTWEGRGRTPTR